jgi:PAS domain S-box-containing protein
MKIQSKIWLATALVLLALLGMHSFLSYRQVKGDMAAQLLEEATNVRGILMAARRVQHLQFLASGLPVNEKTVGFLPAHSLSRIAKDFPNWAESGLYFNGVSDRPRNPGNKADASELAAMDWFRANPQAERRVVELTDADGKPYFHFASPLYIEAYCLICHGDRAAAPPSIRDTYSEAYGYKLGDLRGVLSIKIPMARHETRAWAAWRADMLVNLAGYVMLFFVLGFLINRLVARRLARLEATAGALAAGDYSQRSLQSGSDEVSSLARAIDQMAEAVQVRDGELLEREKKLSVILAAAPVGVGVSVDRVIIEANDTLCKLLNYSREEMNGLSSRELYEDPAEADRIRRLRDAQFATKGLCVVETRWRTREGRVLDILLSLSPLVPGDLAKGTVFAVLDIADRKKYEQQLEESQAQLETQVTQRTADLSAALEAARVADQAKDAFLANVSHELRTPLNAVIGLSSLARRTSTEPEQQDQLNKVIGAGKTLASLINDLLDLSKIVAGRMELESTTFSLRSVVHRCSSVISYRAAEKGLKLLEQIDEAVPDALVGDPLRFEQILLNLLSNAVKFTTAGQVEIRIGLQPAAGKAIGLKIEVEDSGVGMSDVQIGQLFQPFVQADPSMSRKYGGTGLGLAICKNLVEMMGGEISVRSRAGQGSTFCASLCFAPGHAEDIPAPEAPGGEEVLRYRDVKILVVEDQPLNREIVEALLRLVGISARMAANGQEALDVLAASGPDAFDLVLMDIQMPVMDGLTATRLLRSRKGFEAIPVIAMTAHTMTHEKEQSAAAGMNDHIGKPFDNAGFYRTLARWIPPAKQQAPADAAHSVVIVAADLGALSGIDCAAGLSRLAGNEVRYRHWLSTFVEEGPASVAQIRQALDAGNSESARQLAHALKGRVGMLGMDAVHVAASGVEAALKSGAPAVDLLAELERVVAQIGQQISAVLGVVPVAAPVLLTSRPDVMPEALAQLVAMLDASDGRSATAIAACLDEMKDSPWAPYLQQALAQAQSFDFVAARETLGVG